MTGAIGRTGRDPRPSHKICAQTRAGLVLTSYPALRYHIKASVLSKRSQVDRVYIHPEKDRIPQLPRAHMFGIKKKLSALVPSEVSPVHLGIPR